MLQYAIWTNETLIFQINAEYRHLNLQASLEYISTTKSKTMRSVYL